MPDSPSDLPAKDALMPPSAEGQPTDASTQASEASSQYVTKAEYEKLAQELRRVQSSSDKGLNAIRQEMRTKLDAAVNGYKLATGQEPSPEQKAAIQQRIREEVLSPDEVQPQQQPGQAPASAQPQPTSPEDPYMMAANAIAAQVDGGLSDKDPEIKMIDTTTRDPQAWLNSVVRAVQAKQARLTEQNSRSPNSASVVAGNGAPGSAYDPLVSPLELLSKAHRKR